ncbi:MAG: YceI family protein [Bacteroidetes bacterium]|nr:MAG: YceI family protein [Bacteroidota bacterium]
MKQGFISFLALGLAVLGLAAFTLPTNRTTYTVSTDQSVIVWKGYKVTGEHTGTINLKSGTLEFEDGRLVGGRFEIDMTSIQDTDLSGKWKTKLENHLKSDDFFGVEQFPVSTFVIKKVAPKGTPGDYKIVGDLTIKGITKEIKFYAHVEEAGGQVNATAKITVDRTEFNVRYGSGSFFDNLGDKTIYDEFDLEVTLVAVQA